MATPTTRDVRATRPTSAREREPVLDLLRGFAVLGILLVNVEFMRGSAIYGALVGELPAAEGSDRVVEFLVGWLAAGKFVSSFSIMFGIGAGFLVARALRDQVSPRRLLARRYALLAVLGIVHMLLLFPGDILFVYAVTGFVLLTFINVSPRTALWWSGGLLAGLTVVVSGFAALGLLFAGSEPVDDPFTTAFETFLAERAAFAATAYAEGGLGAVLTARAFESAVIQSGQLLLLPWFLALFLLGFALQRRGVVGDLATHRPLLRRVALIGVPVGLVLNLPGGLVGTLGAAAGTTGTAGWLEVATAANSIIGAPVLAAGYLATIALLGLRLGAWRPLAATGRMALSAYLLQSLIATIVFVGFGFYEQWSATQALGFVAATWLVVLVVCPLWLTRFRFGPVEWLWRSWTYRSWQRLRADRSDA